MPHWLVVFLLVIFAIHFVVFSGLLLAQKDKYYAAVSLTFLFLVISYSLRLWFAHWLVAGLGVFWVFRIAAWGMALISICMTIRRYMVARKK